MTSARAALLLLTAVLLAGCSEGRTPAPAPQTTAPATTSAGAATVPPAATTAVTVTATSSPTPQPPTPTAQASGACAGDALAVTSGPLESADNKRQVIVSFRNASSRPCTLVGYPGADLVTPAGGVLINVPRRPANSAPHLELDPGEIATADVTASAIDAATGKACARWGTLVVTAPNDVVPHQLSVDVPICDASVSSVG